MRLRFRRTRRDESSNHVPSEQESQITRGLASLREATAKEVMTPRVDVVGLPAPVHYGDVVQAVRRSGHSHFPVYQDDLDRLGGVLFVKDLFQVEAAALAKGEPISAGTDVTGRVREPYVVPETRSALEILSEMRRRRRGFAVVVDEYGGFSGVLTINDLVSELVGDLRDEFDSGPSPAVLRIDETRYLVDGSCTINEVREETGADIADGEYVTLGGFLLDRLGAIPKEGDVVEHQGFRYRVVRMDRHRVAKVVIERRSVSMQGTGDA